MLRFRLDFRTWSDQRESLRRPDIRNVALIGHGHSGKTTLTAGFLFTAGATNRLTRVDEGNTITDFDEEEVQRKITISTASPFAEWKEEDQSPRYPRLLFINDTRPP